MSLDNNTQEQRAANTPADPDEIDLMDILGKLWRKRKFILGVAGVFTLLGLFIALFSPVAYTASCTVVPQSGKDGSGSGIGNLAAMMGFNMASGSTTSTVLSPLVYPQIAKSLPFTREIMQTEIVVEKSKGMPITLYDYYVDKQYKPFNLLDGIMQYTIGLPGLIIEATRKKNDESDNEKADSAGVLTLSPDEERVYKIIQKSMQLQLNQKEGYFTLSYSFPAAEGAAQIAEQIRKTLEKYVTAFKIAKVEDNLSFVQQGYDDAKQDFLKKQTALAVFQDANRGLVAATARTTQDRLQNEYNIAYTVYNELAKQLEQAKLSVKETKPILTVIDPVVVPTQKSAPRRGIILAAFLFLGIVVGVGWVFVSPIVKEITTKTKENISSVQ